MSNDIHAFAVEKQIDQYALYLIKQLNYKQTQHIIGLAVVVFLEISLHPLTEFKIVKIPSLDQLGDIDVPLDAILVKCSLKNFIVLNEFVLVFC